MTVASPARSRRDYFAGSHDYSLPAPEDLVPAPDINLPSENIVAGTGMNVAGVLIIL